MTNTIDMNALNEKGMAVVIVEGHEPAQVPIHVALANILRCVQAIPKDDRNAQQNYAFRGIDRTVDALHNLFAVNGVVPLPSYRVTDMHTAPTRSGGIMEVITLEGEITFVGPMGDSLTVQTIGHASDTADKAANQAMQAALKYALFQTFLIPTGDPDADFKTEERAGASVPSTNGNSQESAPRIPRPGANPTGASAVKRANPQIDWAFLDTMTDSEFVMDVLGKLDKYGKLSEKQLAALERTAPRSPEALAADRAQEAFPGTTEEPEYEESF